MVDAACRGMGTDIFFAERNDNKSRMEAQMVCFSCPVRGECDDYRKRTNSQYGMWAGKNIRRGKAE